MRTLCKALLLSSALTLYPATLLLASAGKAAPQATPTPQATKPQTNCPVMGGPIDKNLYVDAKGKRIYICCMACEDAIRAEPEKYIEKIEKRGQTLEDAPTP